MSGPAIAGAWTGALVGERLRIRLTTAPGSLLPVDALVGLALRRNPRRAQLLVSRALAKHVPTPPGLAIGAGRLLGAAVAVRLGLPWDPGTTACGTAGAAGAEGLAAGARALEGWLAGTPAACREVVPLPARPPAAGVALATIGYAETATGLGHLVAEFLGSYYVHSTRAAVAVRPYGAFEEEHSHATSHQLTPTDPGRLAGADAVVLVDDELSTGQTVLNTVRELHGSWRPEGEAAGSEGAQARRYVVATLVDLRSDADRARFDDLAVELGCELSVVALAEGRISLPEDLHERSATWLAEVDGRPELGGTSPHLTVTPPNVGGTSPHLGDPDPHLGVAGRVAFVPAPGAAGVSPSAIRSARYGVDTAQPATPAGADAPDDAPAAGEPPLDLQALEAVDLLRELLSAVPRSGRILVLGSEEHLALPLAIADGLAFGRDRPDSATVLFSSTTRSPVLAQDDPGYAIRSAVRFASHDHAVDGGPGTGLRFAYNLATPGEEFDVVVYVPEPGTPRAALETPGVPGTAAAGEPSAVEALARVARHVVVLQFPAAAPFPEPLRGPGTGVAAHGQGTFGSYPAEDVGWLLTDLSGAPLEAPTHVREAAIQSGRASYAESLPHEYEPSPEYRALFREALAESAGRIAEAVGSVTEQVLELRAGEPVLVSLARAGTPVGILMRRWAREVRGIDVPHYTMSIVRGLGIDANALRFLLTRHRPEQIMFVDGWTGKGAIARELAAAVEAFAQSDGVRLSPELAVLADPGHCVRVFGTRDDFLIPSACLNSTVSGLVSRTVYNRALIGPHDYHGAKFYRELADGDVSSEFVEAVAAHFPGARGGPVSRAGASPAASKPRPDTEPTWAGWAAVERIAEQHGLGPAHHTVNLVKPGVGETTRVLLRRVPWKVLARPELLARDAGGRLVRGELAHVLLLAEQRGVPVEPVEGLPYSCVGLIHPKYTPGATGADGKTVLDV
ncbi:phosphoribosyltransferase domain-containing protein [Sinomonas mesophila]|uniref:phosphoribosyltransferase domain-containing protein n=1 Tax=Sinomonas mesophila TaxID=1531955 RepID=UPI001FECB02E|nr:phosphoribosyltransferase domain-containing protein [Sinomonas mesophila]